MEGYVQGALRKKLYIVPFAERFKATTMGKSYWYILPELGTIYLNIAASFVEHPVHDLPSAKKLFSKNLQRRFQNSVKHIRPNEI